MALSLSSIEERLLKTEARLTRICQEEEEGEEEEEEEEEEEQQQQQQQQQLC